MRALISICLVTLLSACGGGGTGGESDSGSGSNPGSSPAPVPAPAPFVAPAHYSASSYPKFDTTHSTDNSLEGTWLVFMDGSLITQDQQVVNGSNYREERNLYSRYVLRFKKQDGQTDRYFINSCGPFTSRDSAVTRTSSTVYIPFYTSACCSTAYQMSIVDPVTIEGKNLTGSSTGGSGRNLSWNLSFTLKRISDDPFKPVARVHDNKAASTTESGCPYESEGTYVRTQNDSTRQNFREEGQFYTGYAYPSSALNSDSISYASFAQIEEFIGRRILIFKDGSNYSTDNSGTAITLNRTATGNSTRADARVGSQASAASQVDMTFELTP